MRRHFLGRAISEEQKAKISATLKGRKLSVEHKRKMSEGQKGDKNNFWGKTHSVETRAKISKANETRRANGNHPFLGKKHSEETKQKMSRAARNRSAETLRNMSQAQVGKKQSLATRSKQRELIRTRTRNAAGQLVSVNLTAATAAGAIR